MMGSAGGIDRLANEAMSSAVGSRAAPSSDEWCAVFGTVTGALDGFVSNFEVEGGKNFFLYVLSTLESSYD